MTQLSKTIPVLCITLCMLKYDQIKNEFRIIYIFVMTKAFLFLKTHSTTKIGNLTNKFERTSILIY